MNRTAQLIVAFKCYIYYSRENDKIADEIGLYHANVRLKDTILKSDLCIHVKLFSMNATNERHLGQDRPIFENFTNKVFFLSVILLNLECRINLMNTLHRFLYNKISLALGERTKKYSFFSKVDEIQKKIIRFNKRVTLFAFSE